MIAEFIYIGPLALTIVLYAVGSARFSALKPKIRLTLAASTVICLVANMVLLPGAGQILSMFGRSYAEQAFWCLRILGLCAFPVIIRYHYVAFHRIQGTVSFVMIPIIACGLLELSCAALGAHFDGLTGLSLGLLTAMCIEGLYMSRTVFHFARFGATPGYVEQRSERQSCDNTHLSNVQMKEVDR
jgi:Na+-driven multidrug efflux pump